MEYPLSKESALYVDKNNFHDFSVRGGQVLLHIPTTAVFVLDRVTSDLLNYLKKVSRVTENEINSHLADHSSENVNDAIADFRAIGVLKQEATVTNEIDEIHIREFPISTIVLNVNTGCNLSCTYCYKEDLAKPSNGKRLSFENACKGIELLIKEGRNRDRINVVFFGGEPLSNMNLIREVTAYTERRCAEEEKGVDFSLTTNATLLTEEIIDYFNEHRFGLSISIDGPEAIHNRHRLTVGGVGTYGVVRDKVSLLLARYTAKPVGARVTVTSGYTDVRSIHHHLKTELGFAEVGIAPVTSNPMSAFNLGGKELRKLFESMKDLGREYTAAAVSGTNNGFSNMHQLMSDLYEGRKKSLPCGAGVGLLAVDHKGDLNLCHRFTGSEMPLFGDVNNGINKEALGQFIDKALDRNGKSCSTCRIRNLC